ncbi:MAG TPA: alpha-amylase family glycosyl hydrolase [Pyrinomonadaceae bacterium]|jgi:glycosidase|nr:alpha-amylase family glycosyl hydrolase [Pyrinomonadaceae bacterium]
MKRFSQSILVLCIFTLVLSLAPRASRAADFKRETIYQIITDRFFDGSTSNNNPSQSAGLYDSTKTNWRAYWGGDLAGIQQKMSYLAGMGVTAIWISPPVDNLNTNIPDANGNPTASYHGYQGRDFKRVEEHFGNSSNTWTDFDNMVTAAHQNGIKVIIDFAPNHTTQDNAGEFGAFYDNGTLLGNFTSDTNGYFHHNANISGGGWDDRYQVEYYTLFDLADLNQENSTVDAYLKASAQLFQQHGVDGFRIDAVKHVTWGWEYSFANSIFTNGDSFLFGEWYQGNTSDPLYHDSYKFANKSGISLLDFPLNTAIRNVFGSANTNFSDIDSVITQEASNFNWKEDLVTFIDNHDMARFLSINNNNNRLHEALAFIETARGIPCIYYGTEQYLHNDTSGGTDPYNRPMMNAFSTTTTAYQLLNKLSTLRRNNPAIAYGSHAERWINNDVYIYERKFFGSVVLIAINKNETTSYNITGLNTSLPAGSYTDNLTGLLSGPSIAVSTGTGGNNPVANFTLPAHAVSVWQFTEGTAAPEIGSVGPAMGQPGVRVTLGGKNFGSTAGTVKFGTTAATIVSWSSTKIVATTPAVTGGNYNVTATNSASQVSNGIQYTVLTAKLIPVTFTVNNAAQTVTGDYIFLTGNTIELGNWATTWDGAVGPMLTPNYPNWFLNASVPAGQTIQFKFIKIAANGAVTWEGGANHTYTVPASGVGFVNVNWQN